jgi:hypothetical protein
MRAAMLRFLSAPHVNPALLRFAATQSCGQLALVSNARFAVNRRLTAIPYPLHRKAGDSVHQTGGHEGDVVTRYRVCYRRGSFALTDNCESYGEALARARYLKSQRGVWTVRLENMAGALIRGDFDLEIPESYFAIAPRGEDFAEAADPCPAPDRPAVLAANSIQ